MVSYGEFFRVQRSNRFFLRVYSLYYQSGLGFYGSRGYIIKLVWVFQGLEAILSNRFGFFRVQRLYYQIIFFGVQSLYYQIGLFFQGIQSILSILLLYYPIGLSFYGSRGYIIKSFFFLRVQRLYYQIGLCFLGSRGYIIKLVWVFRPQIYWFGFFRVYSRVFHFDQSMSQNCRQLVCSVMAIYKANAKIIGIFQWEFSPQHHF